MDILKRYTAFLMFVLASLVVSAQDSRAVETAADTDSAVMDVETLKLDSIGISILTCTPGTDVYAKFGHTALRVKDYTIHKDVVFNYGCFDGSANDFVFKFLLGQTDYLLEAEPYDFLVERYGYMGNGVKEQVLNLTQEETNRLLYLLLENIRPENQEYRYVWLYDNCTERARDMVERAIEGKVIYQREKKDLTIRQMLHECLENDPWISFGIDMILGAEIDQPADRRIQMFLPDFFSAEADEAVIEKADGTRIPYIVKTNEVIKEVNEKNPTPFLLSPVFVCSVLLLLMVLSFVFEWMRGKRMVWLDVLLHIIQGLGGIIVAFLFFFSEHPAVDSNWLVIILNPLPLCYAGWMVYCQQKKKANVLSYVNLAVLLGFLVTMWACPQSFNTAMWLVVLSLLVRGLSQAHFAYHGRRRIYYSIS